MKPLPQRITPSTAKLKDYESDTGKLRELLQGLGCLEFLQFSLDFQKMQF